MRKPENDLSVILSALASQFQYNFGEEGEAYVRNQAAEAVVRSYPRTMDAMAMSENSDLNHVYELGRAGSPRHRLFKMIRKEGRLSIVLKPARMVVPLSDTQRQAGENGRVVKKRYRFPARPWVFEYGRKVVIARKPGTKWMWTTITNPRSGPPPVMGPIVTRPPVRFKFAFRKATRIYLMQEGKMVVSNAARLYAKDSIRSAAHAARVAKR